MTLIAAIPASVRVIGLLVDSAIRGLALAGVAGLGLAALRVKSTTVRLFTWTSVLYAALAMPMLQWMLPTVPVPTPAVLQAGADSSATENIHFERRDAAAAAPASSVGIASHATSVGYMDRRESSRVPRPMPVAPSVRSHSLLSLVRWNTVAAGIYFAVALLLMVRILVGFAFGRRLLRASQGIEELRLTRKLASRAHACGLASLPAAAESELISVPLTMGVLRATILLPSDWREWDDAKLDAVVAHEVSHVARRDALTQRLSLLHRAIFWFSPLAWWLDRRLADLAEQASDEAALTCGADCKDYARTLLGFFEALQIAPGRVWWQGVSMAKAGQAEKRLERILSWKGSVAMRLKKSVAVAVLTFAVPVVYLAASVHAANKAVHPRRASIAQDQTPPAAHPAPPMSDATPPSEAGPSSGVSGGTVSGAPASAPVSPAPATGVGTTAVAPLAPASPVEPVAPPPPSGGDSARSRSSYGHGFSYAYGYDDEQRFVIVSGKSDSLTISGTTEDARHVERLRKQIPGDFIWFQRDEKSYIIRDQATIDRARKLWAPQEELGKKQEELGRQQEALGKQQEELGARMEQIHVNVPDMTAELDKLKAELKQLSSNATVDQLGDIQSEIGELQSKIGEAQSRAGDQQGKLGAEMGAVGEKQGKVGAQQGELGRQQGKLAEEASRQMKQLLDEAIAKGDAQLEL